MASVELRPGDTLHIVWSSVQDTPLGTKEVESSFAFSYDELLSRLRAKGKMGKSRRSGTDGARFSRIVALAVHALKKGKWSTGADIDRTQVFSNLIKRFQILDANEYQHITQNARKAMLELFQNKTLLKAPQKQELKLALAAMGLQEK
jgi:hypothetical protein